MGKTEFFIFKSNTDAIATNRGFYYQYLTTIKLWLDNFVNKIDNNIYCEREDDIFELNSQMQTYNFHQIKCYSEGFGLNSPEIKSSLLNFYNLYLKYQNSYSGYFHFVTNADFKTSAGKSLKDWYEKQKSGQYSAEDFVDETKQILSDLIDQKLSTYITKKPNINEIKKAELKALNFKNDLNSPNFLKFLNMIRWHLSQNNDTNSAISKLLKEIHEIISSGKLLFDQTVDKNLLLGYILNTVIEKSIEKDETQRLLTNELLQKILFATDLQDKIREKLLPEVTLLIHNDFMILDRLDSIEEGIRLIKNKVNDMNTPIFGEKKEDTLMSKLRLLVTNWFIAVGYKFEVNNKYDEKSCEFIINIPKRRGYDRVFVSCIPEMLELNHLNQLEQHVKETKCSEGWLITYRRIAESVRKKAGKDTHSHLFCFTVDELLDETTDFTGYFNWLENEIKAKFIDNKYIQLYCKKDVFHQEQNTKIDTNKYNLDEYINQWLDDPTKNHISILGEFGTGKTWFTLHFAWIKLQEYKKSKEKGLQRPRIPLFIPLRDFAKAISIESVFSEFFFKKHNSPIPNYDTFIEMNKMGKLLLIFDGFDEMADRIDTQKMINNFWELAKVITNDSKIILTCRNEHFPEALHGRKLLNAELIASTQHLIAESPQFEVLDLLKFNAKQIEQLLNLYTNHNTVKKIMHNKALLDLARRPIMVELILDALKDIEANKVIDISRVYLYAITKKLQKDIKEERTFTSIPDKLYFMCELSWEMLLTDKMSINYRLFPDRIRNLFGEVVKEEKDIDHWQYDMMGQTLLIRDDEGNYKPAHRSLLEFFVAYKFAAELGVLDFDFTELAIDKNGDALNSKVCRWDNYFKNSYNCSLSNFEQMDLSKLKETFGKKVITRAILDLIKNMISIKSEKTQNAFLEIIEECRYKTFDEVGYIVTNLIILLTDYKVDYFAGKDLSNLSIKNFKLPIIASDNFSHKNFKIVSFNKTNFSNSDLSGSDFGQINYFSPLKNNISEANFENTNLNEFVFHYNQIESIDYLPHKNIFAVGSPNSILLLNGEDLSVIKRIPAEAWHIKFSPNSKLLIHSGYGSFSLLDIDNFVTKLTYTLSKQKNLDAQEHGENLWTGEFTFTKDSKTIFLACNNGFVYSYDLEKNKEMQVFKCFRGADYVSLSNDEKYLTSSNFNEFNLWCIENTKKIFHEKVNKNLLNRYVAKFHPFQNIIVIVNENKIRFYDVVNLEYTYEENIQKLVDFCFSSDGKIIYGLNANSLYIIDFNTKSILNVYTINIPEPGKKKNSSNDYPKSIFIKDNDTKVYILTMHQITIFDLENEKITDTYNHLHDMTGTNFTNVTGLDTNTIIQLKKNGALFKQ